MQELALENTAISVRESNDKNHPREADVRIWQILTWASRFQERQVLHRPHRNSWGLSLTYPWSGRPLVPNLCWFQQGFSSVDHSAIGGLLIHYEIPTIFINLIKEFYEDATWNIINSGKLTDATEVKTGVHQSYLL